MMIRKVSVRHGKSIKRDCKHHRRETLLRPQPDDIRRRLVCRYSFPEVIRKVVISDAKNIQKKKETMIKTLSSLLLPKKRKQMVLEALAGAKPAVVFSLTDQPRQLLQRLKC